MNRENASVMPGLLDRAGRGEIITTRDDQDEFADFLDAVKTTRRRGGRLRLVDGGRFSLFELEWLAEAGADIYTSDEARENRTELELLARACARGGALLAYFHRGELTERPAEEPSTWGFLREVGRSRVDVHLSDRERPRDLTRLADLAEACRDAAARLVFYHHGRLEEGLERLARAGGWIHLSDLTMEDDGGAASLGDLVRLATAAGSGVVLHVEKSLAVETLEALLRAGAFLLFKTPPSDRRSRLGKIEEQARKKKLDPRSYYLHTALLP